MLNEQQDILDIELPAEIIESFSRAIVSEIRKYYLIQTENHDEHSMQMLDLELKEEQV